MLYLNVCFSSSLNTVKSTLEILSNINMKLQLLKWNLALISCFFALGRCRLLEWQSARGQPCRRLLGRCKSCVGSDPPNSKPPPKSGASLAHQKDQTTPKASPSLVSGGCEAGKHSSGFV